eukprot:2083023-Pleurochrysis_carterae.AAC.2
MFIANIQHRLCVVPRACKSARRAGKCQGSQRRCRAVQESVYDKPHQQRQRACCRGSPSMSLRRHRRQ